MSCNLTHREPSALHFHGGLEIALIHSQLLLHSGFPPPLLLTPPTSSPTPSFLFPCFSLPWPLPQGNNKNEQASGLQTPNKELLKQQAKEKRKPSLQTQLAKSPVRFWRTYMAGNPAWSYPTVSFLHHSNVGPHVRAGKVLKSRMFHYKSLQVGTGAKWQVAVMNMNEGNRLSHCLTPKLLSLWQFTGHQQSPDFWVQHSAGRRETECFSWALRHKRKVLGQMTATVLTEGQDIFTGVCLKTTEMREDHVLRLLKRHIAANGWQCHGVVKSSAPTLSLWNQWVVEATFCQEPSFINSVSLKVTAFPLWPSISSIKWALKLLPPVVHRLGLNGKYENYWNQKESPTPSGQGHHSLHFTAMLCAQGNRFPIFPEWNQSSEMLGNSLKITCSGRR